MNLNAAQSDAQIQFDKQSDNYGKSHILADTADLDATAAAVEFPTSRLALDVATGGGHTALWLVNRRLAVTATDLSKKMLENAQMLANAAGQSGRGGPDVRFCTRFHPVLTPPRYGGWESGMAMVSAAARCPSGRNLIVRGLDYDAGIISGIPDSSSVSAGVAGDAAS